MAHFAYVKQLADGRGFPTEFIVANNAPGQESSQPPLFYVSAALAVRMFASDTRNFAEIAVRNPSFPYEKPSERNDNRNVVLHSMLAVFPFEGAVRALHVARLIAVLFGAIAVWATYRLSLEVFPEQRAALALLAAATIAFTPQFVFISSSASNDSSAVALGALSLWATVRVMRLGLTVRRGIVLGLLLGLAALSKASAIGLAPLAFTAVLAVDVSGRTRIGARLRGVCLALLVALLCRGRGPCMCWRPLATRWAIHRIWRCRGRARTVTVVRYDRAIT